LIIPVIHHPVDIGIRRPGDIQNSIVVREENTASRCRFKTALQCGLSGALTTNGCRLDGRNTCKREYTGADCTQ
jgi:hypothetical protein